MEKMLTFFDRLDIFLNDRGLNDNQVTLQTGIGNGIIGKARKRGSLSQENIERLLCSYPDLNANWLFTGKGDMLINNQDKTPIINKFELRTDHEVEQQRIPLFEMEAAAGILSIENSAHKELTPTGFLSIPNLPPCDGGLFVRGDSMYPLIKSGDVVLYKQTHNLDWLIWGEMYMIAFTVNGEDYIVVKYINKGDDPEHIRLVSYNTHHAPIEVPVTAIRALAIIKASVRYHTMG